MIFAMGCAIGVSAQELPHMQQTKAAVETGINDVRAAARVADAYYDLSGRLLNGKPSNKGIFINIGQKIIMK